MIYGYLGASKALSAERKKMQKEEILNRYPEAALVTDTRLSSLGRPNLSDLINKLEKGDRLVIFSVSLFDSDPDKTFEIMESLLKKGVAVECLHEPYLSSDLWNLEASPEELLKEQITELYRKLQIIGEKRSINATTNRPGTRKPYVIQKEIEAKKVILENSKSFDGTLGDDEVRKLAGISRNTYYSYKRELKKEREEAAKEEE